MSPRWITERLGTTTLNQADPSEGVVCVDVTELVDRGGNAVERLLRLANVALAALARGKRVLLCCDHGISRSNAMAALVLGLAEEIPFSQAVHTVLLATDDAEIQADMLDTARAAYNRQRGTTKVPLEEESWLVTGASGYLGAALARSVPSGIRLVTPARDELDLLRGSTRIGLVLQEHSISRVLHLAAPRVGNINSALGQSLTMLRNLLDACKIPQIPVLIPSRWEVFSGYEDSCVEADESTGLAPKGVLGDTKFLTEMLAREYAQRAGLEVTILRSGLVYGAGSGPNFLLGFIKRALRDEPIVTHRYANGTPALDLLHVDDWIRACLALLRTGRVGGVYHCGSGRLVGTPDAAHTVVRALSSRSRVESADIGDNTANVLLRSDKLTEITGWTPRAIFEAEAARLAGELAKDASTERGKNVE